MLSQLVPLLCWSLLAIWQAATADNATYTRVQLSQEETGTCPAGDLTTSLADGSIRQLTGAQDRRTCTVECSLWQSCVAVFYSAAAGLCQLGTLSAWLQRWQVPGSSTPGCFSHVRPPALPASLQSKLLMFFNFRFSLANQVDATTYLVAPSNAQRTRMGLELLGTADSKAEVNLMGRGLSSLAVARQLTFFIKVSTTFDNTNRCFHSTYNRTQGTAAGVSGSWCRASYGKASFMARDLVTSPTVFTSSSALLPMDTVNQLTYSTAVTFAPSIGAQFMLNTASLISSTISQSSSTLVGDDGLAIGFDAVAPFKGFVHCYGVASTALIQAEIALLDGLC